MAPATGTFRILRSIMNGHYEVDPSSAIDEMAKRLCRYSPPMMSIFYPFATIDAVREAIYVDQVRISMMIEDLEFEGENAEAAATMMSETLHRTKRQLGLHLVASAGFALAGIAGLILKNCFAAVACFISSIVNLILMINELNARGDELDEQFDCLRDVCNNVAKGLIELAARRDNHNYAYSAAKKRFGDAIDSPAKAAEEGVDPNETFDPDAPQIFGNATC